ncbi:MAG: hypothetical protein WHX52_07235 [Anaerolineae bacterium]
MPHTFKNLYPQIYDFDNLYIAWRRARRGGKRKWLGYTTDDWEKNDSHLTIPFELLWPVSDRAAARLDDRLGERGRRPARALPNHWHYP